MLATDRAAKVLETADTRPGDRTEAEASGVAPTGADIHPAAAGTRRPTEVINTN